MINNDALEYARLLLSDDLGDIGDLPSELQNTIANIYYKCSQHALNQENADKWPRSIFLAESVEEGFKRYIEETIFLLESKKALPGIIASFRQDIVGQKSRKEVEFVTFALLGMLKYRVPNAMQKSALRVKIECWLRRSRVDEVENLYRLFRSS